MLFKRYAQYVSLNVLGMLGLSCYILADTFFVSKGLGANGLTALNLAIPIYSFIHGSGLMIGMGGGTKYTIQKSQQDHHQANAIFTYAFILGLVFAIVFVLMGLFFSDPLIRLLGADTAVYEMAKTYLQVILLFSPAFLLNNIILCFVRNDGDPTLAMIAMLAGSFSNVILDWIFIFPCQMGIFGAVFATGLAPIISLAVLSKHFIQKKNQFHPIHCSLQPRKMLGMMASGVPSLVTEVSSGVVMIVFNTLILGIAGNMGVAAYGVIANLSLVVISVYTGIAQGIQPLMSSSYGHRKMEEVHTYLKFGVVTCLFLSVLIYTVIYFGAQNITQIFNSEHNLTLQSIATQGLCLYFLACPFAGMNIILSMFFTSTEKPLPAHFISLCRGFILIIPMALILSRLFELPGIWLSFPITEGIICIAAILVILLARIRK